MPKLSTLKPRLKPMSPKLTSARTIRDKRYSADAQVRSWYKSARWEALRQQVFIRDNYTCQQTGVILTSGKHKPNSAVAHHKIPHHGDEALFWDIDNVESVAKSWHDADAQRAEKRAL